MFSHRTLVSGRIPELLDHLKAEYENLAHDVNMYKVQKDDFERKLQAQLTTLGDIQRTLLEYETNHTKIKHQYEEEILRLRRQIEFQNSSAGSNFHNSGGDGDKPTSAPNIMSNGGSAMFFSLGNLSPMNKERFQNNAPSTPSGGLPPVSAPPNSLSNSSASINPSPSSSNLANNPLNKRPRENENFFPQPGFLPLNNSLPSMGEPNKTAKLGDKKEESAFPILSSLRDGGKGEAQFQNRLPNPGSASSSLNMNTPTHSGKNNPINIPGSSNKNGVDRQKMEEPIEIGSGPEIRRTAEDVPPSRSSERDEHKKEDIDWSFSGSKHQTNLNIDLSLNLLHSSVVCCVKFSNDGKYLASGCKSSAQIYDVQTGEKLHTFMNDSKNGEEPYIRSVRFSPDGKHLAAGGEDKTVKVWDIEQRHPPKSFYGHELDIYSLDYSSDNRFIISGSGDKKIKIWDVEKVKCLYTLGNEEVGPKDGVTSVAISPDGKIVAAGSLDRIVRIWNVETGQFLEKYEGHLDSVYSVCFSPDGKYLASGSLDKTLKLWDLSGTRSRSRCRSSFSGHKDFVLSVAFSPDGNFVISGSKDRTVQFWEPKTSANYGTLQGHKNSVISVAINPHGRTFATGSGDFCARIWSY